MLIPNLDRFLSECTHEAAKLSADQERQATLGVSTDYASRLAERATFRRLLADDTMDAVRFRFWFTRPFNIQQYNLDDWRRRIDAQIAAEEHK